MEKIEAQVLDAHHLKLSRSLALPPGSRIVITITPAEDYVAEYESWVKLAAQHLDRAYGDQEPDYSLHMIKEPNPDFQP